jgi:voltage-gated potassium channel
MDRATGRPAAILSRRRAGSNRASADRISSQPPKSVLSTGRQQKPVAWAQDMDWKQRAAAILDGTDPRVGRSVVFVLYGLIVFSALSVGIETLPDLPPEAMSLLNTIELVIVLVFTAEYMLRIAIARHPFAYIFSFWGIVDLVAILPFYLSLGFDLRGVRGLRILRIFRLLKIARYSGAVDRITNAFRLVREELVVFGVAALVTLYLCSVGIYYFEHDAQPEIFSSVFASMWWAAVTLTTVGYGDEVPVTVGGRIFTVLVLLIALGIIAVPTGLISSAMSRIRHLEHDDRQKADGSG